MKIENYINEDLENSESDSNSNNKRDLILIMMMNSLLKVF